MNLADVFTVLFIVLGFLIVFVGYWLLSAGLFPHFVERCAERLGRAPVKTTLLGAVTFIPVFSIGLWISSVAPNGGGKSAGLAIALFAALGALLGSAGIALRIGTGLKSARDEQEPWRRVLRGGIVLGLTFVMPFLGTFVVMPLAFLSGFGACVASLMGRPKAAPAAALVPPPIPVSAASEVVPAHAASLP
jgi:hypothetical protein